MDRLVENIHSPDKWKSKMCSQKQSIAQSRETGVIQVEGKVYTYYLIGHMCTVVCEMVRHNSSHFASVREIIH